MHSRGSLLADEMPYTSPCKRFRLLVTLGKPNAVKIFSVHKQRKLIGGTVAGTVAGTCLDGLGRTSFEELPALKMQSLTRQSHRAQNGLEILLSRGSGVRVSPGAPHTAAPFTIICWLLSFARGRLRPPVTWEKNYSYLFVSIRISTPPWDRRAWRAARERSWPRSQSWREWRRRAQGSADRAA